MRRVIIAMIFLGCLTAVAAVVLVNMSRDKDEAQELTVLVAAKHLLPWFVIQASDVIEMRVPRASVAHEPDNLVGLAQAVGKFPAREFREGDTLTASSLLPHGCWACRKLYSRSVVDTSRLWPDGCPARRRARVYPEGMTTYTVTLSRSRVLGGDLYPHCRVDAHWFTRFGKGELTDAGSLQGIEVVTIAGAPRFVEVCLAVTPGQADLLRSWVDKGRIKLILRSPELRAFASDELTTSGVTMVPRTSSAELTSTRIVPTLETPLEDAENVIWCASFPAALEGVGKLGSRATVTGWLLGSRHISKQS